MNFQKWRTSKMWKLVSLLAMTLAISFFCAADTPKSLQAQSPTFNISVKKVIDWNGQTPVSIDRPFQICIQEIANSCLPFTGGQTQRWQNLPAGDYTIVEEDPGGLWQVSLPNFVNATTTFPPPSTAAGYRRSVTNKYIGGKLQVNTDVDWGTYDTVLGQSFKVCIEGPDSTPVQQCQEMSPQATFTWEGLIPGQYVVTQSPQVPWITTISPSTVSVPSLGTGRSTIKNRVRKAEISLSKQASPTSIASGQTVTFDFSISHTNSSEVYVTNVAIVDERCAPAPKLLSGFNIGDSNNNNRLDLSESWAFSCQSVVNSDSVDSATATATHPLGDTVSSNQAETTVDVLPEVVLIKSVTPGTLPEPGGTFIYTIEIQNPSQEVFQIMALTDDYPLSAECTNLIGRSLQPADTVNCSYGVAHSAPGQYSNIAEVTVADNDNNNVSTSDAATVTISDVPASLAVNKAASTDIVPTAGAQVDFTITVTNTSRVDAVKINQIGDSIYGDVTFAGSIISATDCIVGQTLQPQEAYVCTFSGFVDGEIGDIHTNFVTVKGEDSGSQPVQASDSATIVVIDSNPELVVTNDPESATIPEPGGDVRYNVTVQNVSVAETITISTLESSAFGDITKSNATVPTSPVLQTTCVSGAVLIVGERYSCSFVAAVAGSVGEVIENTVVAIGTTSNGDSSSAFDLADVVIVDVPAALVVTKTPSKDAVPESGEEVVFSVRATNASTLDSIRVDAVVDDIFGNVSDTCVPMLPAQLGPGVSISCVFTETVAGNTTDPHVNTVTVSGFDDDDNALTGEASAQINFNNVPSEIQVIKKANRPTASRSGDPVQFEVKIANLSDTDTVTINQIDDSIYGDITNIEPGADGTGSLLSSNCVVPQILTAGALYECTFEAMVNGALNEEHRNIVAVVGIDDDLQPVSGSDDAVVLIADPVIEATKSAQIVESALPITDSGVANPGDTIRYAVVINNAGNASAEAVVFNDIPDDNTTLVVGSVQSTVGTIEDGNEAGDTQVVVRIDDLPAGASATVTFDVEIAEPLPEEVVKISNQGLVTGGNFPTISTQNPSGSGATETFIQLTPVLVASKTAALAVDSNGDGNFSPGDQILYEVVIRNDGSAAATTVVLNDLIDANATLVSGSVNTTLGDVTLGNGTGDSAVKIEIPTLESGESASIRFTVRIKSPLSPSINQITNQASVSSDQTSTLSDDPDVDGAQDPTIVGLRGVARVDASKNALLLIDQGDTGFSPGDMLIYQITIRNSGSVATDNVIFEDMLDPNTTLDIGSVQTDQGNVVSGNNDGDSAVKINLGEVAPDARIKISFRARINAVVDPTIISLKNQGLVTGDGFNDVLTDDPTIDGRLDPTETVLRPTAILKLTVTDIFLIDADKDNLVSVGDTILYQLSLSNVGRNVARQILVEDTPDPYTRLVASTVNVEDGTIEKGNGANDETVLIAVDSLGEDETVMMSFQAKLVGVPPSGVLRNQALARFVNTDSTQVGGQQVEVQSDDPSTDESEDATLTYVGKPLTDSLYLPMIQ